MIAHMATMYTSMSRHMPCNKLHVTTHAIVEGGGGLGEGVGGGMRGEGGGRIRDGRG